MVEDLHGPITASDQFHLTAGGIATDHDPPGDSDEISILEFDPSAFLAVVQESLDPCRTKGLVKRFTQVGLDVVVDVRDHHDRVERGDGFGPGDAGLIVVLLNTAWASRETPMP